MDYKKFIEIMKKEKWPEYVKLKNLDMSLSGDEYRSFCIQFEHFIEHIEQDGSPLKWLPLEFMTEEELAEVVYGFLNRSKENRLLFQGLDYSGYKYDYTDLMIQFSEKQEKFEKMVEDNPKLKEIQNLAIDSTIINVNQTLMEASKTGYKKAVETLFAYVDKIYVDLHNEIKYYDQRGCERINTSYFESYIQVGERICFGILYFFIIANDNIKDKMEALKKIEKNVNKACEIFYAPDVDLKAAYKRERYLRKKYEGINHNQADRIVASYIHYLTRRAFYEELKNIEELVRNEENLPQTEESTKVKSEQDNFKEYITDGRKINAYDKKLNYCIRLIDFAQKQGNLWGDISNDEVLKICFGAIYMSKVRYKKKQAATIVRQIVEGEKIDKLQILFLDVKLLYGTFCEKGLVEEYDIFLRIIRKKHFY